MEEDDKGRGGTSSSIVSSFPTASDPASLSISRQRFTVELRPGETTILSWKKLIKDANRTKRSPLTSEPPTGAHPSLESRIAPGQPAESEVKDEPPSNRFSTVIEKIERLYMGKQSSDEEEFDDVPDDDQYDTEDSFIDDADLDEYFQVDKSTTKHNGYFVNRGKLEHTDEPTSLPNHHPKKRRRKDLLKERGEKDGEHVPNKHAKLGNEKIKAAARTGPSMGKKSCSQSQSSAAISVHYQDGKLKSQVNAPIGPSRKKSTDSNIKLEHSSSSAISKNDASVYLGDSKDIEKQKAGVTHSRDLAYKPKSAIESSEATHQLYGEKSVSQFQPQSRKLLSDTNELELPTKVRHRETGYSCDLPDLNIPGSNSLMQTVSSPSMHTREGSSVRPKGRMLERAIRELEKIVAESRPPTMDVPDADTSSQAVKRRLPREVKQKLAKVARLASSQGKISKELINRLMSILGHLMQLRTLKRNLKAMVELGLSAKQEKDDRLQQIKKEVVEMIQTRAPPSDSKAQEKNGTSDVFQEAPGSDVKGKYSMDNAMEDKICDLYDLYVEGMDEDKGTQIRKLYVELSELWPTGFMDNHAIKNAVYKAKKRKKALYSQRSDQEKIKRKKLPSTPRPEEVVRREASSIAQPRSGPERFPSDFSGQILTSPNRMTSNMAATNQHLAASRMPDQSLNSSRLDRPKKEKVKAGTPTFMDNFRTTDGALMKKKVKRKPEFNSERAHFHSEKLSLQGKEKQKSHLHKSSLQSAGLPSFEQPN